MTDAESGLEAIRGDAAAVLGEDAALGDRIAFIELLHGVLDRGVCVSGDVVVSVAGVDLLFVGVRLLLSSVETMERNGSVPTEHPAEDT